MWGTEGRAIELCSSTRPYYSGGYMRISGPYDGGRQCLQMMDGFE